MSQTTQYVLMPPLRTVADTTTSVAASTRAFLRDLVPAGPPVLATQNLDIQVVDSIAEEGIKLVEMSEATANALRALQPELVVAPVVYYQLARAHRPRPRATASVLRARRSLRPDPIVVRISDRVTGDPMPGIEVAAFTDFANRWGRGGFTDAQGELKLDFGAASIQLERLYAFAPRAGHWGHFQADVTLSGTHDITLEPIDLTVEDSCECSTVPARPTMGMGFASRCWTPVWVRTRTWSWTAPKPTAATSITATDMDPTWPASSPAVAPSPTVWQASPLG